jgi:hypothetical protein
MQGALWEPIDFACPIDPAGLKQLDALVARGQAKTRTTS